MPLVGGGEFVPSFYIKFENRGQGTASSNPTCKERHDHHHDPRERRQILVPFL